MTNWIVIDTETTGLEPGSRLVEIAAIHLSRDGESERRFAELIHPGMPIPRDATAIHGINDQAVANAPPANTVLERFLRWLPVDVVWIGHTLEFDLNILAWEFSRADFTPLSNPLGIDTVLLAKRLSETSNNRLETLIATHQWNLPPHRASADAEATRRLFCRYLSKRKRTHIAPMTYQPTWSFPRRLCSRLNDFLISISNANVITSASGDSIIPLGIAETPAGIQLHGWSQTQCHRVGIDVSEIV